jgi:NAD(P) transhydrogenase subunit alpha
MYHVPADDYLNLFLGFIAVLLGTLNISGGFFVTGRILSMFSKKKKSTN